MRIALHDADRTTFPNLALLKLASYHRAQGDSVEWYIPLMEYDVVYSSKVFSWTPENSYLPRNAQIGGTGYKSNSTLPESVEHACPDYSLARVNYSIGFLTRGCIRSCPWCVVPQKEGEIHAHADIEEFCRHKNVVLMDNNVLAHAHGIEQIEKMIRMGLRVDFNQGLDARLIDEPIARRLAALGWIRFIRLACDRKGQMREVERAVRLLRAAGCRKEVFCYVLVQDVQDALERVEFLREIGVTPFAQPYRAPGSIDAPKQELRSFSRWVNHKAIFKSVSWQDYDSSRRGRNMYLGTAKPGTEPGVLLASFNAG